MQLIFASQNSDKITEISTALGNGFSILSLLEMGINEELEETQNTFEGNALQKARFVYEMFKKPCFADDSGLEIVALDGKPGIFSARYANENKDMKANIDKVLGELKGIKNRQAQFRTVIALIIDEKEIIFEGIVKGAITEERHGIQGFGYDPIFIPDGYQKTFAEMTLDEKNKISHRAIAIEKLKAFFNKSN